MDSLRFFRSVSSFGHVLFRILQVFSAIGAVAVLFSILALSFLPAHLVTVDITAQTDLTFDLRSLLGDSWDEMEDQMRENLASLYEGATLTEDGFTVSETTPAESVENRGLALAMIPTFVQLSLSFALFLFLARAFRLAKNSLHPFRREITAEMRNAGWLLLALGCVPALCATLISLLTRTSLAQGSFDLYLIFGGFLLWALSDLFSFAETRFDPPAQQDNPNAF